MFAAFARFSVRFRWPVLIAFLVLFPLAGIYGGGVFASLSGGGFDDPTAESTRAGELLLEQFGAGDAGIIALYTVTDGSVRDSAARASITAALDRAAADPAVERVVSLYNTGAPQFVSNGETRTFAMLVLRGDEDRQAKALPRLESLLRADGIDTRFGGVVPAGEAINNEVERGLQRAELIAFPVTAVLLVLIFGSLVSAGAPLLLGGLAIMLAFATLRLLTLVTDVSIFAANIVTVLGLGLAIDYSLFIISRYREELSRGSAVEAAIVRTISTTGRAVAFSGVTVAAGLAGLFVFPQMFLRSMALGGIAVAVVMILISLTLLPALLAVLGHRIDALRLPWLARRTDSGDGAEGSFWRGLALRVMRRPVVVAVAVIALLLALGLPFLRINASVPDHRVLGQGVEARQVGDILDAEFPPHEATPHELVLRAEGGILTPERVGALYDYTRQLATIAGITRVDSVFSVVPGLTRDQYQALYSIPAAQQEPALAAGLAGFARDGTTRLNLISEYAFDDRAAQRQVEAVRALTPPAGMTLLTGGQSAALVDLKDSIAQRTPLMLAVIGAVMFVVLFLVFGSVLLPLKAMAMNALSLTASYGALVWIFQDGRFESILRYESLGSVNATQPILMFAIVFGLSMDYEVLLLSRVREEYNRTGDNRLAVAHGIEKTGRLITSAAALLALVFLAFATSSIVFMKELGIGMALAVALDATVVRGLLVPALMQLMGRWNWWSPAPLTRLWRRAGLGNLEGHGATGD